MTGYDTCSQSKLFVIDITFHNYQHYFHGQTLRQTDGHTDDQTNKQADLLYKMITERENIIHVYTAY